MNQMELVYERDEAFVHLEKKSKKGVMIKDLRDNYPKLFRDLSSTKGYIRNLRDRNKLIQVRMCHGRSHYYTALNLYNMFHFRLSKEKIV